MLIFLVFFISSKAYCLNDEILIKDKDADAYSLLSSKKIFANAPYRLVNKSLYRVFKKKGIDSISTFKKLAFSYSKAKEPGLAGKYIEKYIQTTLDVSFVNHSYFNPISDSETYIQLANKYAKKLNLWSIFCLYVGFIGVFIAIVLNFRKCSDRIANLLISVFVFQHSIFVIHISLLLTNYEYYLPHTLYMSTSFSFLYGPIIYFYFKRVLLKYRFRTVDMLHLLPTILLVFFLIPIYNLPIDEKLRIMLHDERPYLTLISDTKLVSLYIYMVLAIRVYVQFKSDVLVKIERNWQRNIVILCSIHTISYTIYNILSIRRIVDGFPYYLQISSIALLVLYISYTVSVQPSIFGSIEDIKTGVRNGLSKYKKSGLTKGLSLELKEKLLALFNEEKVYRKNDISLQELSELLGATRHNTSQIINEHFGLNFFELINKYRIDEAKELLKTEKNKKINIIDVAYEVGFNNKVTFNKSFKKYNKITPSEYVKS